MTVFKGWEANPQHYRSCHESRSRIIRLRTRFRHRPGRGSTDDSHRGPSKFDLSTRFFVWSPRLPVVFNADCPVGTAFDVYVLGVEAEDGSGESWFIQGTVGEVRRPRREAGKFGLFLPEEGQSVSIYFRTDTRRGHVKFLGKGGHKSLAALDQVVQKLNQQHFGDGRPVRR